MTCANHPERPNTAFCQNCGKPLCADCARTAGTAVFCEPCLAARLGTQPGQPLSAYPPPPPSIPGEPSPALAAILGFIPGVGAMYNGQYAKGVVHLVVFALLASLVNANEIFLLFVFGWVFYQVFEAHHTARALRDGTPLPNPFGLNDIGERMGFGRAWPATPPPPEAPYAATPATEPTAAAPNAPPYAPPYAYNYGYQYPPVPPPPLDPLSEEEVADWHRNRVPTGAIWLIGLGLLFLAGNFHLFPHNSVRELAPFLLIGFGIWVFVQRMAAPSLLGDKDDPAVRRIQFLHAFNGGFWMVLIGVLWLLESWRILRMHYSWPIILIAIGVMLVVRRSALIGMPIPVAAPPPPPAPVNPGTAIVPQPYNPDQER